MGKTNRICIPAFSFLIASLFVQLAARQALAQPHDLNQEFFARLNSLRRAGRDRSAALAGLRTALSERQQRMEDLIATDPAGAIAAALPADVRDALPAQLQNYVERLVNLEGEMEVRIEDGPEYSRIHHALRVGGKRVALHFGGPPPGNLATGDRVQVEGVQSGERLALTANGVKAAATAATVALPNTFGPQKTLVILVNFQDLAAQPYTLQSAYSTTFTSVSNFYLNNSFQQTWFSGDVAGWFTIPVSASTCDLGAISTYGSQAAQNAGYSLGNYTHRVFAFPQTSACTFWGLSDVGGNPSNSWINGNYTLKVVGHELGHALGVYHSHSLACGSSVYAAAGCSSSEYGDTLDIMGNPTSDVLTGAQKELLGWLNYGAQPPITTVTADGTYTLAPVETQDSMPKALKVAGPNGTYYYVESRQAIGDDTSLSGNTNVLTGVVLHNYTPGVPNSSYLLNATPGGSWTYPALAVGKSYTDINTGVTITPVSVSNSGASVQVKYAPVTCTHLSPSLFELAPYTSVAPGAVGSVTVRITNKDSAACGPSSFALKSTVPTGWTAAFSATSVSLAPGAAASVILKVTAPLGTPNGTYAVRTSTYNLGFTAYAASASASETIYTPLTLSITPTQATYLIGQPVSLNVQAMNGTTVTAGAAVTVVITKADGSTASINGTTALNGIATLVYQTTSNDQKGTWQAKATSGSSSATTSFTMQ